MTAHGISLASWDSPLSRNGNSGRQGGVPPAGFSAAGGWPPGGPAHGGRIVARRRRRRYSRCERRAARRARRREAPRSTRATPAPAEQDTTSPASSTATSHGTTSRDVPRPETTEHRHGDRPGAQTNRRELEQRAPAPTTGAPYSTRSARSCCAGDHLAACEQARPRHRGTAPAPLPPAPDCALPFSLAFDCELTVRLAYAPRVERGLCT